ncbi:thiopeptide-type bacteriocin biosynthesis domain-containing protein [Chitinophaga sp. YR573]|uniref:lantibiotic dehydratase n=1 Tax=Chitinophaga sp. YR573 TaxID=1881040 RepID=UPI0008BCD5F2|nr:lantibiotic dehydratase [Chitinophaga sp. YR573]SEW17787.1 thiopeptide-type bacteriocin biosynthesis domain-containing protein [Chitinophaga sp. YR573]
MIKKQAFILAGDFLIRTPVSPINRLDLSHNDLKLFAHELAKDDFFLDAIIASSSEVYERFAEWNKNGFDKPDNELKLHLTLLKYWIRMASRCTPYGAFAGVAPGLTGNNTNLNIQGRDEHIFSSRIDMGCLSAIIEDLNNRNEVKSHVRYFINNTIYKISDHYRYIEFKNTGKRFRYAISEVEFNEYLELVLNKAIAGCTIGELVEILTQEEISQEDAFDFVLEIIESKLLVSELEPLITGNDPLETLIHKINNIPSLDDIVNRLKTIKSILSTSKLLSVNEHNQICSQLEKITPGFVNSAIIQTDLFLSGNFSLKKEVLEEIVRDATKIYMSRAQRYKGTAIEAFINRFMQRFPGREIQLVLALDMEYGIGYGDFTNERTDKPNLLNELEILENEHIEDPVYMNTYKRFQLKKLHESLVNGAREIMITNEEMDRLIKSANVEAHDSMSIFGSLLGKSHEDIDKGNYSFFLSNCGGPTSSVYLGRFCLGNERILEMVKTHLSDEAAMEPDCIFAEIVHNPEPRLANVTTRPVLRQYEIPIVTQSAVESANRIAISDLYISIENRDIILKSKSLNKRVIPRLANAHNTKNSTIPVYRFLSDLQYHNYAPRYFWDWGELSESPFLPRVTFGKIILFPAQWQLKKEDHEILKDFDASELEKYFKEIASKLGLPKFVLMAESDNYLVVDIENGSCLSILRNELLKKGTISLREFFATPDNCVVTDKDGNKYCNEIVIPIKKKNKDTPRRALREMPSIKPESFSPGSQWLYFKVYCGTKTAERLMIEVISPLVSNLHEEKIISKWFFIRYRDPEHHLRIRFHVSQPEKIGNVLSLFNNYTKQYLKDELIHNIQLDSYIRENDRYLPFNIELSEELFHFDSDAMLKIVGLLNESGDERMRWLIGMRALDMFLNELEFNLDDKISLLTKLEHNFAQEFLSHELLRANMNARYRQETKSIFNVLDYTSEHNPLVEMAIQIFHERSLKMAPLLSTVKEYRSAFKDIDLSPFIASHIHMFFNKLFDSNPRKQEWVIYNFQLRYYKSNLAIAKSKLHR